MKNKLFKEITYPNGTKKVINKIGYSIDPNTGEVEQVFKCKHTEDCYDEYDDLICTPMGSSCPHCDPVKVEQEPTCECHCHTCDQVGCLVLTKCKHCQPKTEEPKDTPLSVEGWEERFEKRFEIYPDGEIEAKAEDIKSFISQTLKAEREAYRKEIIEKIEQSYTDCSEYRAGSSSFKACRAYNERLYKLLAELKDK